MKIRKQQIIKKFHAQFFGGLMVSPREFVKAAQNSKRALGLFEDSMLLTKKVVPPERDAPNRKQSIEKMRATAAQMDAYVKALDLHERMVNRAMIRANGSRVLEIQKEERSPEVLLASMHAKEKLPAENANNTIQSTRTAMRQFEELLMGITAREPNNHILAALKAYQKNLENHEILAKDTLFKLNGLSGSI
ncbi:MAG: hypothetical protein V1817_04440, partial [Candidatus Micrarchaeota archaeon]